MIKAYFNEKAEIWDEVVAEKDLTRLEDMVDRLSLKAGDTVLDVGTGTGVFVPFILKRIGGHGRLVCLDFAEEMLKKVKAKDFSGNIEYVCADITDARLDDETFDVVVCYSSFPHFQDKLKALNEIKRMLRKGGWLFVCHTSGRHAINEIHCQIPQVQHDLLPDAAEMRRLLSDSGYTGIAVDDNEENYLACGMKPVAAD